MREAVGGDLQVAMDELFGVKEPRINVERPAGYGNAKPNDRPYRDH